MPETVRHTVYGVRRDASGVRRKVYDVRRTPYYGWFVVVVAAAAMVGTLPGRSQGLGLITESLLTELELGRTDYARLNFWATIAGAFGAIGIGRLIDRAGSRIVLTVVSMLLGAIVMAMSQVSTMWTLAAALAATRAVGQGALSVVSIAIVGHWFKRRINTAMAVYSLGLSMGFMMAFPLVGSMVQSMGWRRAWLLIGVVLVAGLAPLGWAVVRRNPESVGLLPDGKPLGSDPVFQESDANAAAVLADKNLDLEGYSWNAAIRTGAFWIFALGAALYGLVASGIGLFNESILAERGFGADVYYQTLVMTAMTALVGNFAGGWLATRLSLPRLMAIALLILAGGVMFLPVVSSMTGVMTWAAAMGLGGGIVMVLFFSVWSEAFGRKHLGRIQGIAQAMTVLASALGPLLLAWCVELTGSYAGMFTLLAIVIALTGIAALMTRMPAPGRA